MSGLLMRFDWCLYNRMAMMTDTGKGPCDDEDRDWSHAATNQGAPKIASKPPEVRREGRKDPLQVLDRVALSKPSCWTFSLQDSETKHFC